MSTPMGNSVRFDFGRGSRKGDGLGASSTFTSGVPSSSQNCSASGKYELHSGQRFNQLAPARSYTILKTEP